ncbi:MAG: penicillin-binding protein activator, partial [Smithellaceae bacterium]
LYPDDEYGTEMTAVFRSELEKIGGKVDQAVFYSKNQTDFTEQINKITNNRITLSRRDAAKRKLHSRKFPEAEPEEKIAIPMPFEALFIPDSHFRVQMIASQLAFYDVTGIKLVGTSLWHSPDLLKKNAEYLEGAIFADSFSVNSFLRETNDFIDVYYVEYTREPGNVEALAYDTMEIVLSVLEDREIQTREEFVEALLTVDRYRGASGIISFAGNRIAQKTPFILQVIRGKIEQVR